MVLKQREPTPDQLSEARLMLVELERLFEAGGENVYASDIRGVLLGNASALYAWLTCGDFWGGMGSMIDCAFCTPTSRGREVDKRNKREFMRLIVKLGKHQLASGISTKNIEPHIAKWTNIFERWMREDAV